MTTLEPDVLDVVNRLTYLNGTIADLQEAADALKAQLRKLLPPGEYTDPAGTKRLTVSPPTRRFQPDLAEQVLPADFLALCVVPRVDSATAKRVLPPALYQQCQTEVGEPVIRLA